MMMEPGAVEGAEDDVQMIEEAKENNGNDIHESTTSNEQLGEVVLEHIRFGSLRNWKKFDFSSSLYRQTSSIEHTFQKCDLSVIILVTWLV